MTVRKKSLATPTDPPLPPALAALADLWEEWVEHRLEIGKPLTIRAARMSFRQLEGESLERIRAGIQHSIANGYQGIWFPQELRATAGASGKPESTWELKQKLEAKTQEANRIYHARSLEYPENRKRYPDEWAEWQALKNEIQCLNRRIAQ